MSHQIQLKTLSLVLLLSVSFIEAKTSEPPNGLNPDEWQKIQSQISNKSLLQANATLNQNYLKASNVDANINVGDGGDNFGSAVAIDEDTLVVGARYEDGSDDGTENNSGAAYVYVKTNGVWVEQAYLKPPIPMFPVTNNGDQFGIAVSISGDTIAVAAHLADTLSNSNTGAVYIFTRTLATWTYQATITASNPGNNDDFGFSISLDTNTLVVGAPREDGNDSSVLNDNGIAYVYTGSGNTWTEQATLIASNTGLDDNFGFAVSLSGDTVIIGAQNEDGIDDGSEDDSGAAYVFTRSGMNWTQQAYLKASNAEALDAFGVSVGVSGNTVVIGAFGEDADSNTISSSGAAYVFSRSGMTWSEQTIIRSDNAGFGDLFGNSVAIDGNRIVVGAKFEDGDGIDGIDNNNVFNSGAAYLFIRSGTSIQQSYLKASNPDLRDEFGIGVAISGSTVVVSAPGEDSAFVDNPSDNTFESNMVPFINGAGAAYVFSPPDLMFSDSFEQPVVVKLFNYLNSLKSNSVLEQGPVFDSQNHSLEFYGHSLKLQYDYNQQDILHIVKFWLHEVLIKEGLSGQYGLDVIFE